MVTAIEVYSPPAERTLANVTCVGGLTMSSLVPSKMFLANEAFPTMAFVARLLFGAIVALICQASWQGLTKVKRKFTGEFSIRLSYNRRAQLSSPLSVSVDIL